MMRKSVQATFAALAVLTLTLGALAADKVILKDGRTYEGEIVQETGDVVLIKITSGSISRTMTIWAGDIESIQRDSDADDQQAGKAADIAAAATAAAGSTGANAGTIDMVASRNKRVFVIPMKGGVGETFRQDKLEEAIEAGRQYDPDVIVLIIDSPGGALNEVWKLRDYLQEVRNEFRIVAWVKSAISAAAMTTMNIQEIYFMKDGHMGAATAWYGAGKAVEGEALEEIVQDTRKMVESAGHSPHIAEAMIVPAYTLSADLEERPSGGFDITWHEDDTGNEMVSRPGEILTFTASEALRYQISAGTVDDEAEFAIALGLDGWVEVSDAGRIIMEEWIRTVEKAQKDIPILLQKLALAAQSGGSAREQRRSIGEQVNILRELIRWCQRCEPVTSQYGLRQKDLEREVRTLVRLMGR